MDYKRDLYLSWDELQSLCIELAQSILASGKTYDAIVAVTRGGMFPAGLLARELEILHVDTICVTRYKGLETHGQDDVLKLPGDLTGKSVLVVDDLADKGGTLEIVKKHLPDVTIATLIVKPQGKGKVDHFVKETPQDVWVRFPWDTARSYRDPLVKNA